MSLMKSTLVATVLAGAFGGVFGDEPKPPFSFCKDNTCQDCPVSVTSAGTGYPQCVIYNADDIFANQGFGGTDGGGYKAWIDVPQPGEGCSVVIKSPANTSQRGCGYVIGAYSQAVCASVSIEKTFMVQFCCGFGDCKAAGAIPRSVKFDPKYIREANAAVGGGVYFKDADGNTIAPAQEGNPPSNKRAENPPAFKEFAKRSKCKAHSWVADAGQEDYTRPADNTQIVLTGASGPGTVSISHTREQSWSSTIGADFGFADILSLGISMSVTQEESVSDTSSREFTLAEGQSGDIGFTAYMHCSTGQGTCNGDTVKGEVCFPYEDSSGKLAGIYAVVEHS